MGGRTGIDPKLAVKVLEDIPCDELAKVLELVVPFHTREKMHPIKGKKYKRNWKKASVEKNTETLLVNEGADKNAVKSN